MRILGYLGKYRPQLGQKLFKIEFSELDTFDDEVVCEELLPLIDKHFREEHRWAGARHWPEQVPRYAEVQKFLAEDIDEYAWMALPADPALHERLFDLEDFVPIDSDPFDVKVEDEYADREITRLRLYSPEVPLVDAGTTHFRWMVGATWLRRDSIVKWEPTA